jgi:hypothetical protein
LMAMASAKAGPLLLDVNAFQHNLRQVGRRAQRSDTRIDVTLAFSGSIRSFVTTHRRARRPASAGETPALLGRPLRVCSRFTGFLAPAADVHSSDFNPAVVRSQLPMGRIATLQSSDRNFRWAHHNVVVDSCNFRWGHRNVVVISSELPMEPSQRCSHPTQRCSRLIATSDGTNTTL